MRIKKKMKKSRPCLEKKKENREWKINEFVCFRNSKQTKFRQNIKEESLLKRCWELMRGYHGVHDIPS